MTSGRDSAPLYHSTAHVFQINPETKNSWLPKGDHAIPIKFVASIVEDPTNNTSKRELKIIGTDNGETVLDAVILQKTTFTKRSHKFGQWIDDTGTVYGLGFNSEAELTEFIESFQRLQREILSPPASAFAPTQQTPPQPMSSGQPQTQVATSQDRIAWQQQQQQQQQQTNNFSEINGRQSISKGNVNNTHSNSMAQPIHQQSQMKRQSQGQLHNNSMSKGNATMVENGNQSINNSIAGYPRSQSMFGHPNKTGMSNNHNLTNNSSMSGHVTPENEHSPTSQGDWRQSEQLKYENERLRQALEESSKNAGIWHNELLTLRTNNVKLTQALQESKAHVGEWERELSTLRGENQELKVRLSALESSNDPDKEDEYKKDLLEYKNYVEEVQSELKMKENEVEKLRRSMEEMELRNQTDAAENKHMNDSVIVAHQKQKFDLINAKLEAKIDDLANVQKEFSQMIDKLYH